MNKKIKNQIKLQFGTPLIIMVILFSLFLLVDIYCPKAWDDLNKLWILILLFPLIWLFENFIILFKYTSKRKGPNKFCSISILKIFSILIMAVALFIWPFFIQYNKIICIESIWEILQMFFYIVLCFILWKKVPKIYNPYSLCEIQKITNFSSLIIILLSIVLSLILLNNGITVMLNKISNITWIVMIASLFGFSKKYYSFISKLKVIKDNYMKKGKINIINLQSDNINSLSINFLELFGYFFLSGFLTVEFFKSLFEKQISQLKPKILHYTTEFLNPTNSKITEIIITNGIKITLILLTSLSIFLIIKYLMPLYFKFFKQELSMEFEFQKNQNKH